MTDHPDAPAGASPERPHIAEVTSREELIYLLSQACELEHNVACIYLFAAYSLKSDAAEGGLTPDIIATIGPLVDFLCLSDEIWQAGDDAPAALRDISALIALA